MRTRPTRTRLVMLLAGALLAPACTKEEQTPFVYTIDGKPADPAAPPAGQPATQTVSVTKPALPPSGDPAAMKNPEFYLPSEADLTTTASGLKYLVLREGSGTSATLGGQFTAHYCGWFTNGQKFDSSYERNEPLSYAVNQMIKGWQEALVTLMKPGAEYILVVPPELGYGPGGNGIPPNSTLVFRMELLSVSG